MEQSNASRLNAKIPHLVDQRTSSYGPLVTPSIQRIIEQHPEGEEAYHVLAKLERENHTEFRIYHLDDEQIIVMRSFEYESQAVIMTENESLNHYGPHQATNHTDDNKSEHRASIGWGVAKFGSEAVWAIFMIVLVLAITLNCNPGFLD